MILNIKLNNEETVTLSEIIIRNEILNSIYSGNNDGVLNDEVSNALFQEKLIGKAIDISEDEVKQLLIDYNVDLIKLSALNKRYILYIIFLLKSGALNSEELSYFFTLSLNSSRESYFLKLIAKTQNNILARLNECVSNLSVARKANTMQDNYDKDTLKTKLQNTLLDEYTYEAPINREVKMVTSGDDPDNAFFDYAVNTTTSQSDLHSSNYAPANLFFIAQFDKRDSAKNFDIFEYDQRSTHKVYDLNYNATINKQFDGLSDFMTFNSNTPPKIYFLKNSIWDAKSLIRTGKLTNGHIKPGGTNYLSRNEKMMLNDLAISTVNLRIYDINTNYVQAVYSGLVPYLYYGVFYDLNDAVLTTYKNYFTFQDTQNTEGSKITLDNITSVWSKSPISRIYKNCALRSFVYDERLLGKALIYDKFTGNTTEYIPERYSDIGTYYPLDKLQKDSYTANILRDRYIETYKEAIKNNLSDPSTIYGQIAKATLEQVPVMIDLAMNGATQARSRSLDGHIRQSYSLAEINRNVNYNEVLSTDERTWSGNITSKETMSDFINAELSKLSNGGIYTVDATIDNNSVISSGLKNMGWTTVAGAVIGPLSSFLTPFLDSDVDFEIVIRKNLLSSVSYSQLTDSRLYPYYRASNKNSAYYHLNYKNLITLLSDINNIDINLKANKTSIDISHISKGDDGNFYYDSTEKLLHLYYLDKDMRDYCSEKITTDENGEEQITINDDRLDYNSFINRTDYTSTYYFDSIVNVPKNIDAFVIKNDGAVAFDSTAKLNDYINRVKKIKSDTPYDDFYILPDNENFYNYSIDSLEVWGTKKIKEINYDIIKNTEYQLNYNFKINTKTSQLKQYIADIQDNIMHYPKLIINTSDDKTELSRTVYDSLFYNIFGKHSSFSDASYHLYNWSALHESFQLALALNIIDSFYDYLLDDSVKYDGFTIKIDPHVYALWEALMIFKKSFTNTFSLKEMVDASIQLNEQQLKGSLTPNSHGPKYTFIGDDMTTVVPNNQSSSTIKSNLYFKLYHESLDYLENKYTRIRGV